MILGLIEHDRAKLNELSLEMLTFGRRLAEQINAPLHAIVIGNQPGLAERLAPFGVARVHLAQHPRLDDYAPEAWAQSTVEIAQTQNAQAIIAAGSERGNEVMAHIAARIEQPMAANCIEVQPGAPSTALDERDSGQGSYVVTRLRWGGSLLEDARLKGSVKLFTIAPHTIAAQPANAPVADFAVETFTPNLSDKDFRVRVTSRVESAAGKVSLADARVVVGGGRGVGSAEGFAELEELAALLGAAVGGSRVVTGFGWRPHSDQVGLTGTHIAPELYIACGISGAIQHMVGAKGAKRILAINTDPEAPIISKADYAIIGDLHQVVPALSAEIRKITPH
jgi:electron transfer flavoprotein alpha subunit